MRSTSGFKDHPDFRDHEALIEISRPDTGLKAYVAIHSRLLGPAVGGTRMYQYNSEMDAISDVLRLSRAMTYKCALAGVNFGGGKAVIIGDPKLNKTKELLLSYAEEINKLRGQFYTGEDVGLFEEDIKLMLTKSKYFIGNPQQAGDPSPYAAMSTFIAIKAACKYLFGVSLLKGRKILVKGVGKVGRHLVALLLENEALVTIADIDPQAVNEVIVKWPKVKVINHTDAYKESCDVYAPCALGNEITQTTAGRLQAKIVCGAANNQLESDSVGEQLYTRGIIYIPDYVANAGGLINVVDELSPDRYNAVRVNAAIQKIEYLVIKILENSSTQKVPTNKVADFLAEGVLSHARHSFNTTTKNA